MISVVICTRDRPEHLRAALHAVAEAVRPGDEVIVVDSASSTPATQEVAAASGARVLRCDEPGASRARNLGWRAASHPVVAFTDDDCRPRPGWTESLARVLTDTEVGFVFGRLVPGSEGTELSVLDRADAAHISPDHLEDIGHSANLAVRREALESVGGFDVVLGAGAPLRASEDKDLAWRLLRAGWLGRYSPDAAVVHDAGRGRVAAVRTSFSYGVGEGALLVKQAALHTQEPTGTPAPMELGWRPALRLARRDLRARYELGVAISLARAAGAVVGRVRARRLLQP